MEILSKFFGKFKHKFTKEMQKVKYRIVFQEDFDEITGNYEPEYYLEKKVNIGAWEIVKGNFRSEEEVKQWFDKYLIYLDLKREQTERKKQRLIDL
jgi:hypothetical protein